jgi:hypothetical protein
MLARTAACCSSSCVCRWSTAYLLARLPRGPAARAEPSFSGPSRAVEHAKGKEPTCVPPRSAPHARRLALAYVVCTHLLVLPSEYRTGARMFCTSTRAPVRWCTTVFIDHFLRNFVSIDWCVDDGTPIVTGQLQLQLSYNLVLSHQNVEC